MHDRSDVVGDLVHPTGSRKCRGSVGGAEVLDKDEGSLDMAAWEAETRLGESAETHLNSARHFWWDSRAEGH